MLKRVLIDAGPIVAFLSPVDSHHTWAEEQFKRFTNFVTCDAVLAEACARIAYAGEDQTKVLRLLEEGSLTVDFNTALSINRLVYLMDKYRDQPMDFADACLVVMTEQESETTIVTLDRTDFSIYRRFGRDVVPFEAPEAR